MTEQLTPDPNENEQPTLPDEGAVSSAPEMTEEQRAEHQQMIIERTMNMKRYPWLTEHVAAPIIKQAMRRRSEWLPENIAKPMHDFATREATWLPKKLAKPIEKVTEFYLEDGRPDAWITPEDLEKLPKTGAYLASFNHSHNFDSPFIKFLMEGRAPMVPGQIGLYEDELTARVYRGMGSVPMVRPQDGGKKTMQEAEKALDENLENGEPVFVFDETTRNPKLQQFSPGSARFAARHGLDLYPIAIAGTHMKGSPVAFSVGDPIPFLPEYKDMHPNAVRKLMHAQLQTAMEEQFIRAYKLLAKQTDQAFEDIFPGFDYERELEDDEVFAVI